MHELQKVACDRIARGRTEDGVYWTTWTNRSLSVIDPFRNGRRWERAQAVEAPADLTCLKLGSMVTAMLVRGFEIRGLHDPYCTKPPQSPDCGKFARTSPQTNVLTAIPFSGISWSSFTPLSTISVQQVTGATKKAIQSRDHP
jgi:hypothetical protein